MAHMIHPCQVGAQTNLGKTLWSSSPSYAYVFFCINIHQMKWEMQFVRRRAWLCDRLRCTGWCGREKTARAADLRGPCTVLSRPVSEFHSNFQEFRTCFFHTTYGRRVVYAHVLQQSYKKCQKMIARLAQHQIWSFCPAGDGRNKRNLRAQTHLRTKLWESAAQCSGPPANHLPLSMQHWAFTLNF